MKACIQRLGGIFGPVPTGSAARIAALLPAHVAASRAEPGCLGFTVMPEPDGRCWRVDEAYSDEAALDHHRRRLAATDWGRETRGIPRDYSGGPCDAVIRSETPDDRDGIRLLVARAFPTEAEAGIVDALRRDGDLIHSLVAAAEPFVIGHAGLSRLEAPFPSLCLAPVSVHPAVQGRGLGGDLIRAALSAADDHVVVVVGDPAYYTRFGFRQVGWESPYAGPCQMAWTSDGAAPLPRSARIRFAPALAA